MATPLPKGPLVQQVCANFRLSVSFTLHLSLAICEDPPSELFSALSSLLPELSFALRVTAVKANSHPQVHPLHSCISSPSSSSPALGSHPPAASLLRFSLGTHIPKNNKIKNPTKTSLFLLPFAWPPSCCCLLSQPVAQTSPALSLEVGC